MTTEDTSTAPHPVDRHVGKRVCELRLERGFSQASLAESLGVTFQQVQKYEKGANRISASKLWAIAGFLNVDVSAFFEGLTHAGAQAAPSPAMDAEGWPMTRCAIDISRYARRLNTPRQRLALNLMKALAGEDELEGAYGLQAGGADVRQGDANQV